MESTLELNLEEKYLLRLENYTGLNENGTERSDLIAECIEDQSVYLRCDHSSSLDRYLIKVYNDTGQQMGAIHGGKELAVHLDRGGEAPARMKHVVRKSGFFSRLIHLMKKTKDCYVEVTLIQINPELHKDIIEKDREIARTVARAEAHEKDSLKLAIRNYRLAIDQIVALDDMGLSARAWRQTRIPVNRLSMMYEKEGKHTEALTVIDWYLSYPDYPGIDPYEMEMILLRRKRLTGGSNQLAIGNRQ